MQTIAVSAAPRRPENTGTRSQKEQVITKAALSAGKALKISGPELAEIIGISPATLTRLKNHKAVLKNGSKDQELALHLIRIFRSLGALYGGNTSDMAHWLRVNNLTLRTTPIEKMKQIAGLIRTVDYLDRFRAKV